MFAAQAWPNDGAKRMGRHISEAFGEVLGFLRQGFDREADRRRAFEAELAQLLAPHLAVLVRRRAKLLEDGEHRRWSDTLDCYMRESLLPQLNGHRDYAERNRTFVALMIDVSIERAQYRTANSPDISFASRLNAGFAN